MNKVK